MAFFPCLQGKLCCKARSEVHLHRQTGELSAVLPSAGHWPAMSWKPSNDTVRARTALEMRMLISASHFSVIQEWSNFSFSMLFWFLGFFPLFYLLFLLFFPLFLLFFSFFLFYFFFFFLSFFLFYFSLFPFSFFRPQNHFATKWFCFFKPQTSGFPKKQFKLSTSSYDSYFPYSPTPL